ncbi:MAG: CapA family protein [Halobacteriales archaeon]
MTERVRIGLTGDVMLGRKVDEYQQRRPPEAVWGNVRDRLQKLDGVFINLECCLSTRGSKWTRTNRPFHFRADPDWALPALKTGNVAGCALANNHILDFDTVALEDTIDWLDEAGIAHAGAGRTINQALDPAIVSVGDLRIGIISFTDNTPEYAADETSPGTARIEFDVDNDRSRERIQKGLSRAWTYDPDLLIASLHWGPNMVTEPSSAFETFGRWLIDEGVDVIHGHSAHVFQGIEVYDGAPILYDTGDFVDDYAVDRDLRNDRGFLFTFEVHPAGTIEELRLFPTEIYDCAVHEADQTARQWCFERMRERSAPFETEFFQEGKELVRPL